MNQYKASEYRIGQTVTIKDLHRTRGKIINNSSSENQVTIEVDPGQIFKFHVDDIVEYPTFAKDYPIGMKVTSKEGLVGEISFHLNDNTFVVKMVHPLGHNAYETWDLSVVVEEPPLDTYKVVFEPKYDKSNAIVGWGVEIFNPKGIRIIEAIGLKVKDVLDEAFNRSNMTWDDGSATGFMGRIRVNLDFSLKIQPYGIIF